MKTGLVSVSFRSLSPEDVLDLAARCGLESIEWGGDVHVPCGETRTALRVGERTRARGLEVACYGSYCRLEDEPLAPVVETAKALGAPLIRVWAGTRPSCAADSAYRETISQNARRLADLAAREGIDIAFEFHGGTLTDSAPSAAELLRAVDRTNAGALWQPPVGMNAQDCVCSLRAVAPWLRNVHVFSWRETDRLALADGAEKWRALLPEIAAAPGEHRLMLEFVRGDAPEQLAIDADCLRNWMGEMHL